MDWRNEIRTCACGERFAAKREGQYHCSSRCRDRGKKRRKRSADKTEMANLSVVPRSGDMAYTARIPPLTAALQGMWAVGWAAAEGIARHRFCLAVRKAKRER